MFTFSRLLLALVLLSNLGCTTSVGISNQGFCGHMTAFDIRIGLKYCSAGDVEVEQSKEAMSKQTAEMLEEIIPQLVEAAVKAALASAGIGAIGDIISDYGDDDDEDESAQAERGNQ
jgi:hypothetical protein